MGSGMQYDEKYYRCDCGPNPHNSPVNMEHFDTVAEHIIRDFGPETVLDVGCAMGLLVSALRERGVNAYGIDISEYAISMVNPAVRSYCRVSSILEALPSDFPRQYDLIVSIEVAEHLYEEEGAVFVRNICKYSNKVLFSSTPFDIFEKTHLNVQQPEYWAKRFAQYGFFADLSARPNYVIPHCRLFYKTSDVKKIIEDYERNIRMLNQDLHKLQGDFSILSNDRADAQKVMDHLAQRLNEIQVDYEELQRGSTMAREVMNRQSLRLETLQTSYETLQRDRVKAQEVMDIQSQHLEQVRTEYASLRDERNVAQEIIDGQSELILIQQKMYALQQKMYAQITSTFAWKITSPVRKLIGKIRG